ncbi:hypothetical protein GCM10020360_31700 [Nonlabens tegetincola]
MGWKHQCRQPGNFRIWARRARGGALWACRCGTWWQLRRRSIIPGHSHWEWRLDEDPAPASEGHRESDTYTSTELAPGHYRDDGERYIPEIQLGFQREQQ